MKVLKPGSEAELAEVIAGAEGPLALGGGFTRGMAGQGARLSLAGISGIRLYEPGAMTLVAGAGTPLAEIEAALAGEGQRLAFEPMDHRPLLGTTGEPTLGGVVAGNVSGPRRLAAGAARDFCLGLRFVDGAGRVVKNGGRVMKNVTGYDLVKLMAGSRGTLAAITEVSLKVLPRPEAAGRIEIAGLSLDEAVAAMSAALGSPFEVTGAAHLPAAGLTRLRIEGTEPSVVYRLERLTGLLGRFGAVSARRAEGFDWPELRDMSAWAGGAEDVWRVHCRPSAAPALVARLPQGAKVVLDWGGGLIWAAAQPGTDLRAALGPFEGHATRVRGSGGGISSLQPEAPGVAALTAGLKARFDPRGIFAGAA